MVLGNRNKEQGLIQAVGHNSYVEAKFTLFFFLLYSKVMNNFINYESPPRPLS